METERAENRPHFDAPTPIAPDKAIIETRRARWADSFPPVKGFSEERMNAIYSALDVAHFALGKSQQDIRKDFDEIAQKIPEMKRRRAAAMENDVRHLHGKDKANAIKETERLYQAAEKFATMDASDDRMRRAVMLEYTRRIEQELPLVDQRVAKLAPTMYGNYKKTFNTAIKLYGRGPRKSHDLSDPSDDLPTTDAYMREGNMADVPDPETGANPEPTADREMDVDDPAMMVVDDPAIDAEQDAYIMSDTRQGAYSVSYSVSSGAEKARALFVSCAVEARGDMDLAVRMFRDSVLGDVYERGHKGDMDIDDARVGLRGGHEEEDGEKPRAGGPAVGYGQTVRATGQVREDNENLYTAAHEAIRESRETREEEIRANKLITVLPIVAAEKLNDLDYATYRVLVDHEHLLDWQQTEKGIAIKAKSLDKLDDENTVAKVIMDEMGYAHRRGASMQVQNTLRKLNGILNDPAIQQVEPTMKVLDRAGTPTEDLTRQIRERKGKGRGGLE